jgi:hypothetical protein
MPDAVTALREAIETVRAQIPKGELTLASVRHLLDTAETVCAAGEAASGAPPDRARNPSAQAARRQEERRKWARIAKEAERESRAVVPPAQ